MKKHRLPAFLMATALTISLTGGALAVNGAGTPPSTEEREANGNTTVSIMSASVDPKNISFTVPLYVTMAVVKDVAAVSVPDNYAISNTSTGTANGSDIGVVAMSFEKLAGSTYNTVADAPTTKAMDIKLSIGNVVMPALSGAGTAPVAIGGEFGTDADTPTAIKPGTPMKVTLAGTVAALDRTNDQAAAQFKVKYTISLLDDTGKPLGSVYAGDEREAAGLQPFVAAP